MARCRKLVATAEVGIHQPGQQQGGHCQGQVKQLVEAVAQVLQRQDGNNQGCQAVGGAVSRYAGGFRSLSVGLRFLFARKVGRQRVAEGLGAIATLLLGPAQGVGHALLQAVGIIANVQAGDAGADGEFQAVRLHQFIKSLADEVCLLCGFGGICARQNRQELQVGHPVIGIEVPNWECR